MAKPKRTTYHVTKDGDTWKVKRRCAERASSRHDTKKAAVDRAREIAKNQMPSQIIVHKEDGVIQTEYTYGDDPKGSKG